VVEPADEKLLVTNTSHEPEEQRPQRRVRIILPREVCTDPETAAKIMHGRSRRRWRCLVLLPERYPKASSPSYHAVHFGR
jgi:hypothetical protein